MSWLQALVLGFVQGITEFLPISSSGHLILLSKVPGWVEQPLAFDTTLHLGTVTALIVYFWTDLCKIVIDFFKELKFKSLKLDEYSYEARLLLYILVGSIPAGILGFLFDDVLEKTFRSVSSVAMFMLAGTFILLAAEFYSKKTDASKQTGLTYVKSFIIGMFQSLALFPGVSRSGTTISGGVLSGLSKVEAARYSFLLSIPIIAMAGVYQLLTKPFLGSGNDLALLIGFITSFATGLAVVHFFLNYIRKNGFWVFIVYRLLLVITLLVFF